MTILLVFWIVVAFVLSAAAVSGYRRARLAYVRWRIASDPEWAREREWQRWRAEW